MTLTMTHLMALLPLIVVCATAITVMLGIAWRRHHGGTAAVTVIGIVLTLAMLLPIWTMAPVEVPLLVVDGLALFAGAMILISSLTCAALAYVYLDNYPGPREEFYLLLLCAAAGGMVLAASRHLATLFVGLELLSMPLYGMLAYAFSERRSLEAGIKYFILSAAATAFLLFGMALLYAQVGRLDLPAVAAVLGERPTAWGLAGIGLLLVGLGFKLSIVPFHLWTPDVYEGAPGPAATFLASASKVAVFVVLLRLVLSTPAFQDDWLRGVLAVLALAGMLVGNLLALVQSNLKRLLGYSSIAHFGYLLVALVVGDGLATETSGVYLLTYLVTTLGAFGVVTLLSSSYSGEDTAALHHYRGLFWRRPYLTAVLTVSLLSLAGIPFTAGFIGKFYIIALGVEAERWWLVGGIIVGSAIGLYYYLRVMVTLYLVEPGMRRRDAPRDWGGRAGGVVVLGLALLVVMLGVYPAPMIEWVRLVEHITVR
ncbi:NADH-quinone oxidoreductase subunit N [Litchfieldella qijiaojingensis]|uniref:NADH-quinone oxidoreductase subunit N n=1 Tax=Litchfieldella qijiaojingensis TaxID=980347 RepID=A0ABQ2YJE6_9GAMM|nr:NADH-quinone oxidoreductase subunit NuoN [Halomonas qijiaojingensis]GGX84930.1 NADH-quinone oxidoreductase subunit N [Halomonas qijiaojingensis]